MLPWKQSPFKCSTREGMASSSGDGCLCLERQGKGGRDYFHTVSSFIQKFLHEGLLPSGCLESVKPLGQIHSHRNALSIPPISPLCTCSHDDYFVNESIGAKKSSSQLRLVTSPENEGLSHHLLHACSHGLSNAIQLVISTKSDLDLNASFSCSNSNEQGFTPLAVASFSNASQVCGLLIKAGAGVNSIDGLQRSALHWAVLGKSVSCVKVLVKNGASAEMVDKLGFTPLMYACILKAPDLVAALLKESQASCGVATPHSKSGATPLLFAFLQGSSEIAKLLLKHGAQLSVSDKQGASSAHYVVWGGDSKCVKLLLSRGGRAVLSQRDRWGRTPLLVAAAKGDVNMCQFLLKKGAWLADVDEGGRTVLHWAVLSQQSSCLNFLLTYSSSAGGGQALVHQKDNEGATPVHYAASMPCVEILATLIEKVTGLGQAQADHDGLSPLVWAAVCGNVPAAEALLGVNDRGSSTEGEKEKDDKDREDTELDVNDRGSSMEEEKEKGDEDKDVQLGANDGGTPPDDKDQENGREDKEDAKLGINDGGTCADREKENGQEAQLDANDGGSPTNEEQEVVKEERQDNVLQPLQAAACVGSKEVCLLMINSGAKVNSSSPTGLTPLHYASRFGHTACAKLLLEHGAMVDAITPQQETGLHLACRYGHAGVTDTLLLHRAKIDRPLPPLGDCPVHLSSSSGHDSVLKVLMRHGCKVDERRDSDGQTSLHLSACGGHLECVEALVLQGCQLSTSLPTMEKLTALDVALLNGHTDVADYLTSMHAPSGGGAYHRAACTIQAVWRFYRHKCRVAIAREWCAAVIQRAVRLWLAQKRAKRLQLARERARNKAAATIQFHWKRYISQKRRYESTYAKLKARLERERVAAELIMTELQYQRHSVELPTTAPIKIKSFTLPTQPSPTNPRYLLKATNNPVSIFPSGSVLFPAKPHRPLLKRIPNIRVATKPNSSQQSPQVLSPLEERTVAPERVCSGEGVRLPPVTTNCSLTASLSEANDRNFPTTECTTGSTKELERHPRPPSSDSVKLPPVSRNAHSLVAIKQSNSSRDVAEAVKSSPSHESALKTARRGGKSRYSVRNSNSVDQLSPARHTVGDSATKKSSTLGSPVLLQSQMRVTRYSIFKDTPLGYKPATATGSQNRRVNAEEDIPSHDMDMDSRNVTITVAEASDPIREQLSRGSPTTAQEQNSSTCTSSASPCNTTKEPHPPISLDGHLYQQAQRYDKLNQVLALLQQAKDIKSLGEEGGVTHSEPGTPPVKISELKAHIKTALDEAVRLRADTEALQHRVIKEEDTGTHKTGTVIS